MIPLRTKRERLSLCVTTALKFLPLVILRLLAEQSDSARRVNSRVKAPEILYNHSRYKGGQARDTVPALVEKLAKEINAAEEK